MANISTRILVPKSQPEESLIEVRFGFQNKSKSIIGEALVWLIQVSSNEFYLNNPGWIDGSGEFITDRVTNKHQVVQSLLYTNEDEEDMPDSLVIG